MNRIIWMETDMCNWEIVTCVYIGVMLIVNAIGTIVISIGGCFDLAYLFRILDRKIIDETDDGRVVSHDVQTTK